MGFLGLNFNDKYKEMLKDLSGHINLSEFNDMQKEKKEELYADYCLLKKIMQDKQEELKKIYFGSADSISRLWPAFIKRKREVNEINKNSPGTTTLEQYFLSDFIAQRQIEAEASKKATERMQAGLVDEILSHPSMVYKKHSFEPITTTSKTDEVIFEQILDEQVKKVTELIDYLKKDLKRINLKDYEQEILKQIQDNGDVENIKNGLTILMNKYRKDVSRNVPSCKAFFASLDPYFLLDYVIYEEGRKDWDKDICEMQRLSELTKKVEKDISSQTRNCYTQSNDSIFEQIITEQVKRVVAAINDLKSSAEQKMSKGKEIEETGEILKLIHRNEDIKIIKLYIIEIMKLYIDNVSSDAISCKVFFESLDIWSLVAYVLYEEKRTELLKKMFGTGKQAPKL